MPAQGGGCLPGGVCAGGCLPRGVFYLPQIWSMSGHYALYCNAFLLYKVGSKVLRGEEKNN